MGCLASDKKLTPWNAQLYLCGDVDVFVNGISPIEDVHVVGHNEDGNWGRITLIVGPGNGLAGVLNPVQTTRIQTLKYESRARERMDTHQ